MGTEVEIAVLLDWPGCDVRMFAHARVKVEDTGDGYRVRTEDERPFVCTLVTAIWRGMHLRSERNETALVMLGLDLKRMYEGDDPKHRRFIDAMLELQYRETKHEAAEVAVA